MRANSKACINTPARRAASALLAGLLACQIMATWQVAWSSRALYATQTAVAAAGYLPVPNAQTLPHLLRLAPMLWGGLFFTLTIGAALGCTTLAWLILRQGLQSPRWQRICTVAGALLWAGTLLYANHKGINLFAALQIAVVPTVVIWTARNKTLWRRGPVLTLQRIAPVLPLILLSVWALADFGRDSFITMRDRLLLDSVLGRQVNDLYYKNTLHAAQTFKSQSQKLLKTCDLPLGTRSETARRIHLTLLRHDYLPVAPPAGVDLRVELGPQDRLNLWHGRRLVLETTVADFTAQPAKILNRYSQRTDLHAPWRRLVLLSLLGGLPLLCYLIIYNIPRCMLCLVLPQHQASLISAAALLLLTIAVMIGSSATPSVDIGSEASLHRALASPHWQQRVQALRQMAANSVDPKRLGANLTHAQSPHVAERYWFARVLATGRDPADRETLMGLLEDESPNVVCMAIYAIGKRGERQLTDRIESILKQSTHWYVQWYAYTGLKRLGWTQSASL